MLNTRGIILWLLFLSDIAHLANYRRLALTVLFPSLGGSPLCRLASTGHFGVELVDLFQTETLGFVDEEPDVGNADEAGAEPDKEDLGLEVGEALAVVDQIGGGVGDGPVEQPVGGGGHAEGLGASGQGEDFAGDDPCQRAPGAGEEEDEDADKGHGGLLAGDVLDVDVAVFALAGGQGAADGDDELGDTHADGAHEEERATAPSVNGQEAGDGGDDVDGGGDHGDGEAAGDARVLKVPRAVVEDEVDARELLEGLQGHAGELALQDRRLEAVPVGGLADAALEVEVGLDLAQLRDDGRVSLVEAAHAGQRGGGLFHLAGADEEARRLGQEDHAEEEDEGPGELDGDGDAVGARVGAVGGGVVDDGGEEEADCDGELVGADDGAADPFGGRFRLIEGD